MKEEHLVVLNTRRRRYNSYLGEISPAVENIIQRDFHADRPNVKWLTDITEFSIPAGKVYLSPIIDCFDGMAVSWSIGTRPNANLVNSMLDQAIRQLGEGEHPIVHSDRGGHYRWPGWIRRMGPDPFHVQKGLLAGQFSLRGLFRQIEERDVLWPLLGGHIRS